MARPGRPERNRTARSFRQLRRFHHVINSDKVFGTHNQPTDAEAAIQRQMAGYWARMARTGNPNGGNDPQWPASTLENDTYLEIGTATAAMKGPAEAKCDFWDTVPFPHPHL